MESLVVGRRRHVMMIARYLGFAWRLQRDVRTGMLRNRERNDADIRVRCTKQQFRRFRISHPMSSDVQRSYVPSGTSRLVRLKERHRRDTSTRGQSIDTRTILFVNLENVHQIISDHAAA